MRLNNKWESFEISFNWEDYVVPTGNFNCWEELGKFIIYTSRKWRKNVKLSENKAKEINVDDKVDNSGNFEKPEEGKEAKENKESKRKSKKDSK